jgi:Zn-finger protein
MPVAVGNVSSPNYSFFENKSCEYYPCHELDEINCLFCFCPLYNLKCGGNFIINNNIKDCSKCITPHSRPAYEIIIEKLKS